jgi:hypothetical protein
MESQSAFQVEFDFGTSKPVVVEPSAGQLSSDAGLLPFRQLDEQLGLTAGFAACLNERRDAASISHTLLEMVRMRTYGILADYADQNDHDTLRSDPVFKLVCDRSIHDDDLASQPTLSRFENAIDTGSLLKLRDWLIDKFIAAFDEPPTRLTLDIDPFDDPTHGQQQLTFFHGYYDQYQYLPRVIVKCEAHAQGTNCRAVVTNRPGGRVLPAAAYDEYADRGESENRNKELKCGLRSDRLSDHRYFANLFRLYLHALAYNLLVRMRHVVEEPPPTSTNPDSACEELPDEALTGRARRQRHNRRRERDPLGQGQPGTWRTRLIKVAAVVWESTRRVVVQLSSNWPYLEHYRRVAQQVLEHGQTAEDTS